MAKECYFTGRTASRGNNRSFALNSSKRSFKPNLQNFGLVVVGNGKVVCVCGGGFF